MTSSKVCAMALGFALFANEQAKQRASNMQEMPGEPRRAICILDSQPNEVGKGVVLFEQKSAFARTHITGSFTGLAPN